MVTKNNFYCVVYISSAAQLYSDIELQKLFEHSLVHNKINGVTGVLVYADGSVLQLLEGTEEVIKNLYHKISYRQPT